MLNFQTLLLCLVGLMAFCETSRLCAQVTVDFSASATQGCGNLQVQFNDLSTSLAGDIVHWEWDLAGLPSTAPNPGRNFMTPGSYTICLKVTDTNGNTDSLCLEDYIQVYAPPQAAFQWQPEEGCVPVEAMFWDQSIPGDAPIQEWNWGLGGSCGVVNLDQPDTLFCEYTLPDAYSATLIVEDTNGCSDVTTLPAAVTVAEVPVISLSASATSSCSLPFEVTFTNELPNPDWLYFWDFGNGPTYFGLQPPPITYTEQGLYTVTVIATNPQGGCADTLVLENFVQTGALAQVGVDRSKGCAGELFTFFDQTGSPADSLVWTLGNGVTILNQDTVSLILNNPGCYTLTLTRYQDGCEQIGIFDCLEVVGPPALQIIPSDSNSCSVPFEVELQAVGEVAAVDTFFWNTGLSPIFQTQATPVSVSFDNFGAFAALLAVRDTSGCFFQIDQQAIYVQPLQADVQGIGIGGCAPLEVTLNHQIQSSSALASVQWSIFQNGALWGSSPMQSPNFNLPDTGTYDVLLIVENVEGCRDTVLKEDFIEVGLTPPVNFTGSPLSVCVDNPVSFAAQVPDYVDEYWWDFDGNGSIDSQEEEPVHPYEEPGSFDVSLTVFHNGCFNSLTLADFIQVEPPLADFDLVRDCTTPFTLAFLDASVGATHFSWDFGVPGTQTDTSTAADPIFTFPYADTFTVTLTASNVQSGCTHTQSQEVPIWQVGAGFSVDTTRGCAPLSLSVDNLAAFVQNYTWVAPGAQIQPLHSANPTLTYSDPGIYPPPILVGEDVFGCQDTFMLTDSIEVGGIAVNILADSPGGCSPFTLSLTADVSSFLSSPEEYAWTIPDEGATHAGSDWTYTFTDTGFFTLNLEVTNEWGCQANNSLEILSSAPRAVPVFDSLGCTGVEIPFQNASVGESLTYIWSFGDGDSSFVAEPLHGYTQEGTYQVCLTVEDAVGCSQTRCKEIGVQDPVAQFQADTTFGNCPPLIVQFENQSTGAQTYQWDFGDNSGLSALSNPAHIYNIPGNYDVQLVAIRSEQCRDTLTLPDYIELDGPVGTFGFELDSSCAPLSVTFQASSNEPYLYLWDYGDGAALDSVNGILSDTFIRIYPQAGVFLPSLTLVDANNCRITLVAGQPIVVEEIQAEILLSDTLICPGDSVWLEGVSLGSREVETWSWQLPGAFPAMSTEPELWSTYSEAGTFSLTLAVASGFCQDTIRLDSVIGVGHRPVADFNYAPHPVCFPDQVQLQDLSTIESGDISSWTWNLNETLLSTAVTPFFIPSNTDTQRIQLVVTSELGCVDSTTQSIPILSRIELFLPSRPEICVGNSVRLQVAFLSDTTSHGGFFWDPHPDLSCTQCLSPQVSPDVSTTYFFNIISPEGCLTRDSVRIEVKNALAPQIVMPPDTAVCPNGVVLLTAGGGQSPQDYSWDAARPGLSCYEACFNPVASPLQTTTYVLTVTNEQGCSSVDSVRVAVVGTDQALAGPDRTVCRGDTVQLSAHLDAASNPVWFPGLGLSCAACPNPVLTANETQAYILRVDADTLPCTLWDTVLVEVIAPEDVEAGKDTTLCPGQILPLNGVGEGLPSWRPASLVEAPNLLKTIGLPDTSAWFYLEVTKGDCRIVDSLRVQIQDSVSLQANDWSLCAGDTVRLSVQGNASQWQWLPPTQWAFPTAAEQVVSPDSSLIATVLGSHPGCTPDTVQIVVEVAPLPQVELPAISWFLPDSLLQLQPEVSLFSDYSFSWMPEEGLSCTDCPLPFVLDPEEGQLFQVQVTDRSNGCTRILETTLRALLECPDFLVQMPNLFSPNGDGFNDQLTYFTHPLVQQIHDLSIFDRWGEQVFQTRQLGHYWDGTFKGRDMPVGTYVYQLRYPCPYTQELVLRAGSFHLIR